MALLFVSKFALSQREEMGTSAEVRARDLRVLSIVQKCTGWLEQEPKRLQTEGIFRVSGSAKVCGHQRERWRVHEAAARKGLGCLLACALPWRCGCGPAWALRAGAAGSGAAGPGRVSPGHVGRAATASPVPKAVL
jgi:hypothetical protein